MEQANIIPHRAEFMSGLYWELPREIRTNMTKRMVQIFLTVRNPNDWPNEMQPLRRWLEDNSGSHYWIG